MGCHSDSRQSRLPAESVRNGEGHRRPSTKENHPIHATSVGRWSGEEQANVDNTAIRKRRSDGTAVARPGWKEERKRKREKERVRAKGSVDRRPVPWSQARSRVSRVSVRLETPARTERESEVVTRLVYLPFFLRSSRMQPPPPTHTQTRY